MRDAVELLRLATQYCVMVPCHYLVADRSERSFVWEHVGATYNGEHVTWSEDTRIVTNHLLWRYPSIADLPAEAGNGWTFDRARRLTEELAGPGTINADELKRRHLSVRISDANVPVRTLWHSLYDTTKRSMEISLHLTDTATGEIRTPYLSFKLTTRRSQEPTDQSRMPAWPADVLSEHDRPLTADEPFDMLALVERRDTGPPTSPTCSALLDGLTPARGGAGTHGPQADEYDVGLSE